ncbi:STAS domain-containing protein [Heyndrickxia sporothermodurans]|uniref:RsbT co-antagonist protein RsbRA n=1 Tax=Heyndrickxia TaxID=2837504 RepID=UPI002DB6671D|nr:RsbT co-antagonist protein RsbRA [Heyndrickxia sporothermodurans]MEB6550522.1 STAS domain-containing protein [Heyndrickxia sporothermodurans]MED3649121.1 RsbT co-antagonist protein RsbRA [Heyndrickxia sporothermodurans]MED3655814.1 RsbT co-antagonist protein RsbRA [Heyndrickxia sporothermodurans]MED3698261.1 RsbT co-antagonist protein RsbRA [Heyndrickxia sporothermodurans]
MYNFLVEYIPTHKDEILDEWMKRMKSDEDERFINVVSDQVFVNTSSEFVNVILSRLTDSSESYNEKLTDFAERLVRLGWPLTFVTTGISTLNKVIFEKVNETKLFSSEKKLEYFTIFEKWMTPINNEIIKAYNSTWERTVSLQKIALQELSAPLIPVFEKISVMPLVGTIDTERAKLIMENLLNGVVKHRAEVVLIDITGVPVVDTMVAHHIIQAADAVRLVGAKCMLVGIRPEIAQTIINLGINLSQIITTSTLRKGIEQALEATNRKIVKWEGAL